MYNICTNKGVLCMNTIENILNILNDANNKEIEQLVEDMSKHQKEIFSKMQNNAEFFTNYSLNDLIFDFDKNFVEKILKIEIDIYLKECEEKGIFNKRNGSTKDITLTTSDRILNFNRPRLRYEKDFDSKFIPKRTRVIDDLNNSILLLYSQNMSVNQIKEVLKGMFKIKVSNGYISSVAQQLSDQLLAWRNRQLKPCYFVVNIDCLYITVRDEKHLGSHKIPVYIAVGTTLDGHKEIVGIYLGNEDEGKNIIDDLYDVDVAESATFWAEVFNDLKDRGVEKILYIVSDGVAGIKNIIKNEFPDAFYQRCVVHLDRNLKQYTTKKDCKEIMKDFKAIYTAPNAEIAKENYDYFFKKYKNKKTMLKHAEVYVDLIMPLFTLPENIRKYIYTNNIVESVNSKVQRGFYGRGALPNCGSALNIVYVNLVSLEDKWAKTHVPNWDKIYSEIQIVHKNDLELYQK